jgi:hypothetical protein
LERVAVSTILTVGGWSMITGFVDESVWGRVWGGAAARLVGRLYGAAATGKWLLAEEAKMRVAIGGNLIFIDIIYTPVR